MNSLQIIETQKQLQTLLSLMDVPTQRCNDLNWLKRNLGIRNNEHPDFQQAMLLIISLLKV